MDQEEEDTLFLRKLNLPLSLVGRVAFATWEPKLFVTFAILHDHQDIHFRLIYVMPPQEVPCSAEGRHFEFLYVQVLHHTAHVVSQHRRAAL